MPSTQTPPIAGSAIDPPSLRPPIDDATIERVAPTELRERLETFKRDGYAMLLDLGAVDYLQRNPRFDVVYHLLKLTPAPAAPDAPPPFPRGPRNNTSAAATRTATPVTAT